MKHHLQQEITNSCKFAIHRRHEALASATHAHAHGTPSSPKRNRNSTLRPFLRRTRRPDRSTVVRFLRKRSVQLKRSATLKGPLVRRPFDTGHVLQKTPQSPATRTLRPCEAPVPSTPTSWFFSPENQLGGVVQGAVAGIHLPSLRERCRARAPGRLAAGLKRQARVCFDPMESAERSDWR